MLCCCSSKISISIHEQYTHQTCSQLLQDAISDGLIRFGVRSRTGKGGIAGESTAGAVGADHQGSNNVICV